MSGCPGGADQRKRCYARLAGRPIVTRDQDGRCVRGHDAACERASGGRSAGKTSMSYTKNVGAEDGSGYVRACESARGAAGRRTEGLAALWREAMHTGAAVCDCAVGGPVSSEVGKKEGRLAARASGGHGLAAVGVQCAVLR